MGLFDQFPYTNFHELNLMWILEALKKIQTTTEQFVAINSLKYADPIQWNITSQYEKNTIVIDPQSGTAYISVQPVPTGVALTNTDYWTVVFDLEQFVTKANNNFTVRVEPLTTLNATFPTNIGEWVIWGGVLYEAKTNIIPGDQYVVDSNIERITVETIVNKIYTDIANTVGDLNDLNTTNKSNVVAAINEILTTIANTVGDLNDLNTTDKANVVAAINEVLTTIANTVGDLNDLNTTDKSNVVAAINDVLTTIANTVGDLNDLNTTDKSNVVAAINEVVDTIDNLTSGVYYNVLDYGVTGDGVTDDSTAINNIINTALSNGGGTLFFPATTNGYLVSSPIKLYATVQLLGESYTKLIGNGNNVIEIQPNPDTQVRGCKIDNFLIVNNDLGGGILFDTSTERIWLAEVNNCKFEHCTHAIFDSGNQTYFCYNCRIRNVYAKNVAGSQIYFQMTRGFFFIEDVIVDYTYNSGSCPWWGFDFSNLAGLTLKNVHVVGPAPSVVTEGYNSNAGGIRITGTVSGIADSGKIYVDIIGCLIDTGKGNTIAITNVDEIYLTNIQCYGCLGQGILLTNCTQVVADNIFVHGASGLTGALADCPGINLNGCSNVNISNITTEYNTGVGVASYQSENVIISDIHTHHNEIGVRSVSSTGINFLTNALIHDNTTDSVLGSTSDHLANSIVSGSYTAHTTG